MFDAAVKLLVLLFLLYLFVLVLLHRSMMSAGGFKNAEGVPIKVFSVDAADSMRLFFFIVGKKTGFSRVDALRNTAMALIVVFLSIFVSLQLVLNVPVLQKALFAYEKHHH